MGNHWNLCLILSDEMFFYIQFTVNWEKERETVRSEERNGQIDRRKN